MFSIPKGIRRKTRLYLVGAFFLFPFPLLAQNSYSVFVAAGDDSNGSLGAAVTGLNASGFDGAITFAQTFPILLSQPLAAVSQSVTFQGSSAQLIGQDDGQSQFLFQRAFTQQVQDLTFQNNGFLGTGLDLSVTAASWSMASNDNLYLIGGTAPSTLASSGIGIAGQAGGNVQVVTGNWTMGTLNQFTGGAGGTVSDTGGIGDQGGAGGSVTLSLDSLVFPGNVLLANGGTGGAVNDTNGFGDRGGNGGSVVLQGNNFSFAGTAGQLTAGNGGDVTDISSGGSQGGDGGSVDLSLNNTLSISVGNHTLQAGLGGAGVTGGAGGGATLTAGSVTLSSGLFVQGGNGGNGVSLSGAGGAAYVSIGSFDQSSLYLEVFGGRGGFSSLASGAGGDAQVLGGTVTLSGTAGLQVIAGAGGDGNSSVLSQSANGGNGGFAGVSFGTLSLTGSSANFKVSGGNGGVGSQGGNGGNGGALSVTLGTLNLNTGSGLTLISGVGGVGGDGSGVNGGAGGAGGSVSFSAGLVTLASGTNFFLSGASGGAGGIGTVQGAAGAVGQAFATIGSLQGQGALSMSGSSSLLQVASGNFAGTLAGNEALQKTSSSSLTLSGANQYSGGTTVLDGQLTVDTGGALGTGAVLNNANLDYINSATAGAANLTNASGATLLFENSSTAGSAVITNLSGGLVSFNVSSTAGNAAVTSDGDLYFYGNSTAGNANIDNENGGKLYFENSASGGTAQLTTNSTGFTDFSNESSQAITVGSIAGNGTYYLGSLNLTTGVNNLSTTVTGLMENGGQGGGTGASLTKVNTGTLTLTGANTYSGGTNLQGGALAFGNALALGTGGVVVNGGTLESAGSALTLQVGGNYSQGSGGTLRLGFGGAGISSFDKLNVTGNINLNGTLSLFSYGALTPAALGTLNVVLLSPGSLTGTFQQVYENLGNMRLLPLYAANGMELESIVPSFQALSSTPNQKAIGADLDFTVYKPTLGVLMSRLGVMSQGSLQAAENAVSPEGLSALFQTGFEGALTRFAQVDQRLSQWRDVLSSRNSSPGYSLSDTPLFAANLPAAQEASMAAPAHEKEWSGFVSGNSGFFNVTGDSNAAGYQVTTYGLTGAGADYRLSRQAAVGLMAGFGQANINLQGGGNLTAGGGQLGLYGLFASDAFYADGLVEGGLNQYTTQRVSNGGTATGQIQGLEWSGAVELGYGWKVNPVTLGPMASLQYTRVGLDGFSESGSQAPLTYPTQSQDSLMSRLGLKASARWNLGTTVLTPEITLAWEHEYDDLGGNVEAGFGATDQFIVAGPALGQDGLLVGVGMTLASSKNFSVALRYQGELGRARIDSQQFGGSLRLGF